MRERLRVLAVDKGGLLGLAALALYVWLAPTWLLGGDNGELAAIGAHGGVPHPSGYPLYVLWLRATSWLPAASPAHAAAIATAILGAAHVVMLHAACRAWGARPAAATLAVGIYAGAPLAMLIYSQAEVFALNGLAVSTILWLAAPQGPLRGGRRTVVLALVAGLALANHLTAALVAPVGLYGAIQGLREASGTRRRVAITAGAVGAFALGLAPYLYLLIAPRGDLAWGEITGLGDVLDHALRREYGSGTLVPTDTAPEPLANAAALAATLARTWLWLGLAAAIATIGYRAVRGPDRAGWLALGGSVLAASAVVLRFNVVPDGIAAWIVERFHLLPALLLAVPVACGIEAAIAAVLRRAEVPARTRRLAVAACLIAFPVVAASGLGRVARGHSPAVDRAIANLLATLPPDAVVMTNGDHLHFGFLYAQQALGQRRDVLPITYDLLGLPWYRDRLSRRLGAALVPDGAGPPSMRLAENVLARGRPMFVDAHQRNVLAAMPSYPHGPLFRVLPRGAPVPPIEEIMAINNRIFDGLDLRYPHPSASDGWAALVHDMYAQWWRALGLGLRRLGRTTDAEAAFVRAFELAPS